MKPPLLPAAFFLSAFVTAQASMAAGAQPLAEISPQRGFDGIGSPADAASVTREIELSIKETTLGHMLFDPDALYIKKGSVVRFVINNTGALDHEFYLGSFEEIRRHEKWMRRHPDMPHVNKNAVTIPAGQTAELVWNFSIETNLEFSCLMDGHREAGMWGVIIVHDHFSGSTAR